MAGQQNNNVNVNSGVVDTADSARKKRKSVMAGKKKAKSVSSVGGIIIQVLYFTY